LNLICKKTIILATIFFLFLGNISYLITANTIWSDSDIIVIKENAGSYSIESDVALDSKGTIHIIYQNSKSRNEVYYLTKTRNENWSDHELVLLNDNYQRGLKMHIDNQDTIHLLWYEAEQVSVNNTILYTILNFYYCYKNINEDWSNPELFFIGYTTGSTYGESFVIDEQGTIHFVISCGDTQEPIDQNPDFIDYQGLYYLYRSTKGQWSDIELLTTDLTYNKEPSLGLDKQGTLHLVYSNSNKGIHYQNKTNEGEWSIKELISSNITYKHSPFITIDIDETIHVLWEFSGIEYTYKKSDSTWSEIIKLTNNESRYPQLVVDANNNTHLIWTEEYSNESGYDLFYKYKPNEEPWYAEEILCKQSPNYPHQISIELDDNENIFVLWEESGNLYLRNTSKTPPMAYINVPYSGYKDQQMIFNGSGSTDPDGRISSYLWDFGDGIKSSGEKTTHRYTDPGKYNVKLTVIDNDGLIGEDTTIVEITTNGEQTPGFKLITIILSLTLILFWKRRKLY